MSMACGRPHGAEVSLMWTRVNRR